MKKIIRNSLSALALASVANLGHAALVQGTLGATSTGSLDIDVSIQNLVLISGLNNISLGTYNGTDPSLTGSDSFCVYRNGSGSYTATVSGSYNAGAGTGFLVYGGTGSDTMAYTVTYNGTGITHGSTTATQTGNSSSQSCVGDVGNVNATIGVTIQGSVLQAAPTGNYLGTITILISPV